MTPARGTAAVLALCAVAAAGCGLGPGSSTGEVELTISRDYGRELISRETDESRQSDTVIRILDRQAQIETRYGGGFVQSIEGLSGGERDGRRFDWFFYVNGIESPVGSADYRPEGGDRIWWDYRDWSSAMRVPAVVGSFPEPFLHGFEGDRWSTDLVCMTPVRTCDLVDDRLSDPESRPASSAIPMMPITARSGCWSGRGEGSAPTRSPPCWLRPPTAAASSLASITPGWHCSTGTAPRSPATKATPD